MKYKETGAIQEGDYYYRMFLITMEMKHKIAPFIELNVNSDTS